jgi:hypothetical protein
MQVYIESSSKGNLDYIGGNCSDTNNDDLLPNENLNENNIAKPDTSFLSNDQDQTKLFM